MLIERKALKRCLGVKSSTPNSVVYVELNKADIISTICDRQYDFFQKVSNLTEDQAVVKNIMNLCKNLGIMKYYEGLSNTNRDDDITMKKDEVMTSTETMKHRYYSLTNNSYCSAIYDTFMNENYRILITRWRLSCFDLRIETGRYDGTPRDKRTCSICNVVEDEEHVLFVCRAYSSIRTQFHTLLQENTTTRDLLNPTNKETAEEVGLLLKLIEEKRDEIF